MLRYLLTALRLSALTILLVGVLYPLAVWGLGQLVFPYQANGSLIHDGHTLRGSVLIGQAFTRPDYFHSRPSAAGAGYDALASGGSNLGPTSQLLRNRVAINVARIQAAAPGLSQIPVDMVTTSGSGLDPDITPANAYAQAPLVAQAQGVSVDQVKALIARQLQPRQWGLLGEPRINVVRINRALDTLTGTHGR